MSVASTLLTKEWFEVGDGTSLREWYHWIADVLKRAIASSISTFTTNALVDSTHVTTTTAPFDEDAELTKIAESCFTSSDFEQLAGYTVRRYIARILGPILIRESVITIGLTELRATMNFEPLPPWEHLNATDPSDIDLTSAPTPQAYYDLIEPRSPLSSLDSDYLYEHNLNDSIAYLDNRFPSIRKTFRRRFEEISRSCGQVLDRETVDRMIDGFFKAREKVHDALRHMKPGRDTECWDPTD